jgi:hypothetical protein
MLRKSNSYFYGQYGTYGENRVPITQPVMVEGESRQSYTVFGDVGNPQKPGLSYASYYSLCSAYAGCEDPTDPCNAANEAPAFVSQAECINAVKPMIEKLKNYWIPSERADFIIDLFNKFLHGHDSNSQPLTCADAKVASVFFDSVVNPKDSNGQPLVFRPKDSNGNPLPPVYFKLNTKDQPAPAGNLAELVLVENDPSYGTYVKKNNIIAPRSKEGFTYRAAPHTRGFTVPGMTPDVARMLAEEPVNPYDSTQ